jgi:cysteine sulfinate desulfinase/cysteine desulfurase-like protein
MNPKLKPPEIERLKLKYYQLLSTSAFKSNLRRYIMAVNNEIGVVQPLKEIGEICRENKVFFHTDAAQAVGKGLHSSTSELNFRTFGTHRSR